MSSDRKEDKIKKAVDRTTGSVIAGACAAVTVGGMALVVGGTATVMGAALVTTGSAIGLMALGLKSLFDDEVDIEGVSYALPVPPISLTNHETTSLERSSKSREKIDHI